MALYPVRSSSSLVHVVDTIESERLLCGRSIPRNWQFEFEGQVFVEVGPFVKNSHITHGEGFYLGQWFAGDYQFCGKCYKKLKEITARK